MRNSYWKRCCNHYTWCYIRRRSHSCITEKPKAVSKSKKRKVNGKVVNAVNGRLDTITECYLMYISNVRDVLTKQYRGYYWWWTMRQSIPSKGTCLVWEQRLQCLYLPPFSPYKPNREILGKSKVGIRRTPLSTDDAVKWPYLWIC